METIIDRILVEGGKRYTTDVCSTFTEAWERAQFLIARGNYFVCLSKYSNGEIIVEWKDGIEQEERGE